MMEIKENMEIKSLQVPNQHNNTNYKRTSAFKSFLIAVVRTTLDKVNTIYMRHEDNSSFAFDCSAFK